MKNFNWLVERNKMIMMIIFCGSFSVVSLAQKANMMMITPDPKGEFVDLKKFGVKEHYDKPNSYDDKEFKPHSTETKSSSVKYEFVIFKSVSDCPIEGKAIEGGMIFLDRQKFKNMGLNVLKGDLLAVFNNEFNILISDKIARKYFGDEDPFNKILILDGKYAVMIKGVFKSKENSLPIEFDFIAGPITNELINQR